MVAWFFFVLGSVATLVVALAFVPLSAEVSVRRHGRTEIQIRPSWGRLVLPPVSWSSDSSRGAPSSSLRPRAVPTHQRQAKPAPARARRQRLGLRKIHRIFTTPGLSEVIRATLGRLLGSLRPRQLRLSVTLGLGDPFETARLLGFLSPAWVLLLAAEPNGVSFAPDFTQRRLDVDGSARVRLVPAMIVLILLRGLLSRPSLRAIERATA